MFPIVTVWAEATVVPSASSASVNSANAASSRFMETLSLLLHEYVPQSAVIFSRKRQQEQTQHFSSAT